MGSWNHTCAITNLPIYPGEKVEVILLKSSVGQDRSSFCYPDAYHTPLPLTFSGEYNNYGAVENCEGVALETIVESLRKNLFEIEEGENKYHDIPARRDEFDIDKLFELDHEGRLFIKNQMKMQYDMREKIRVKHIVIRKEVYDGIIADMTFERYNREKLEIYYISYVNLVDECKEYTKDLDNLIALDSEDFLARFRMLDAISNTTVGDMFSYRGQGTYGMENPIRLSDVLFYMRREGHKDFEAMLDNALRLSMLVSFMSGARKSWVVPSGVGSQDDNTSYQTLCADLTISSAEIIKNYFGEHNE